MAKFIRVGIREERWFVDDSPWLPPGQVPADALRDPATDGNELSVFEVAAGADPRHIAAAFFAINANNKKPQDVGYAVFDSAALAGLGIKVEATLGNTAAPAFDPLHRDLRELSADRLARLAAIIAQGEADVILSKELAEILRTRLAEGKFLSDRINEKLRSSVTGGGSPP